MHKFLANRIFSVLFSSVLCAVLICSCAPISDGAFSNAGNTNMKSITITLPKLRSPSIRALSNPSELEAATASYRVIFSGEGANTVREGDSSTTTFSASFPVGARVTITVECLNNKHQVIVRAVKDITVQSGVNEVRFVLSEDGEEIKPEPDPEPEMYSVTYVLDGGQWQQDAPQPAEYEAGENVQITSYVPVKNSFSFLGWIPSVRSLLPQGSDYLPSADTFVMPESDVTLTAMWSAHPVVSFDVNGGDEGIPSMEYNGTPLDLPAPVRVGYNFVDWHENNPNGAVVSRKAYEPSASITLCAEWSAIQYTITLKPNYSASMPLADVPINFYITQDTVSWAADVITRSGFKISGWSTTSGESATADAFDTASVSESPRTVITEVMQGQQNMDLYAVWLGVAAEVSGTVNGSSFTESYETLDEAFAEFTSFATTTNPTLKILKDLSGVALTVPAVHGSFQNYVIDLNGKMLTGNGNNPVITVAANSKLSINNGTATAATGTIIGGKSGIRVEGYLEVTGITITQNSAETGGGIYIDYSGECVMGADTTISDNTATAANVNTPGGGGVYVAGKFTMNSGIIENNSASTATGGGVYLSGGATFDMSGGNIQANSCQIYGGGVSISGSGTFNMSGGIVGGTTDDLGNYTTGANGGGGICVTGSGTINLSGTAKVSHNKTTGSYDGAGILISSGTLIMSENASVSENTAGGAGGGICVATIGEVYITGNASISGNTAGNSGGGLAVDSYAQSTTVTFDGASSVTGNKTTSADAGAKNGIDPGNISIDRMNTFTGTIQSD